MLYTIDIDDYMDGKIVTSINTDLNQTSHIMEICLHKLESWYINYRIKIGKNKFVYTNFIIKLNNTLPVNLNNVQIPKENLVKY